MSEKPIIFSTEMVKAILDGRKTVTRRVIKPQPEVFDNAGVPDYACLRKQYQKGDILWVKETWGIFDTDAGEDIAIAYKADPFEKGVQWIKNKSEYICSHFCNIKLGHWKSARFMPKWVTRIWLEVLDVRPERLQEITGEGCINEGIEKHGAYYGPSYLQPSGFGPIGAFKYLWDSLNAKRGYPWESNPWVWRIEFKRIEQGSNELHG